MDDKIKNALDMLAQAIEAPARGRVRLDALAAVREVLADQEPEPAPEPEPQPQA